MQDEAKKKDRSLFDLDDDDLASAPVLPPELAAPKPNAPKPDTVRAKAVDPHPPLPGASSSSSLSQPIPPPVAEGTRKQSVGDGAQLPEVSIATLAARTSQLLSARQQGPGPRPVRDMPAPVRRESSSGAAAVPPPRESTPPVVARPTVPTTEVGIWQFAMDTYKDPSKRDKVADVKRCLDDMNVAVYFRGQRWPENRREKLITIRADILALVTTMSAWVPVPITTLDRPADRLREYFFNLIKELKAPHTGHLAMQLSAVLKTIPTAVNQAEQFKLLVSKCLDATGDLHKVLSTMGKFEPAREFMRRIKDQIQTLESQEAGRAAMRAKLSAANGRGEGAAARPTAERGSSIADAVGDRGSSRVSFGDDDGRRGSYASPFLPLSNGGVGGDAKGQHPATKKSKKKGGLKWVDEERDERLAVSPSMLVPSASMFMRGRDGSTMMVDIQDAKLTPIVKAWEIVIDLAADEETAGLAKTLNMLTTLSTMLPMALALAAAPASETPDPEVLAASAENWQGNEWANSLVQQLLACPEPLQALQQITDFFAAKEDSRAVQFCIADYNQGKAKPVLYGNFTIAEHEVAGPAGGPQQPSPGPGPSLGSASASLFGGGADIKHNVSKTQSRKICIHWAQLTHQLYQEIDRLGDLAQGKGVVKAARIAQQVALLTGGDDLERQYQMLRHACISPQSALYQALGGPRVAPSSSSSSASSDEGLRDNGEGVVDRRSSSLFVTRSAAPAAAATAYTNVKRTIDAIDKAAQVAGVDFNSSFSPGSPLYDIAF